MQAEIGEVRPAARDRGGGNARGIGGDARDATVAQQRVGLCHEPARVARLARDRAAEPIGQAREEALRDRGIERQARRKLDEDRPAAIAEAGDLLGELGEERIAIDQPRRMRDRLGKLDGEAEVGGHARRPALIGRAAVGAVEAAVDLDRVEARRIARKPAALGGKGVRDRARDCPAGGADAVHPRATARGWPRFRGQIPPSWCTILI